MSLYHKDGTYIYMTDESPKGMKGALYLAYEGSGPTSLKETVHAPNKVQGWDTVELTNEWREAVGLRPIAEPDEPEAEPVEAVKVKYEIVYVTVCENCEMKKLDKQKVIEALKFVMLLVMAPCALVLLGGAFACYPAAMTIYCLLALLIFQKKLCRFFSQII